jgi:flavin reductase ActVB
MTGQKARAVNLDGDFTVEMARLKAPGSVGLDGDYTVVSGYVEIDPIFVEPVGSAAPTVDYAVFKAAMRLLPSGVVMVTTRVDGRPWGLTISACCSLSLAPPQVLVSLQSATVSCKQILRTGHFGVSILDVHQKALAELGSAVGIAKFIDEFCEASPTDPQGSPIIGGALYHLECSVAAKFPVSDHMLLVGRVDRVVSGHSMEDREPLLYFDAKFWRLGVNL